MVRGKIQLLKKMKLFDFFPGAFKVTVLVLYSRGLSAALPRPPRRPTKAPRVPGHWVRPYLVENTTSRPICEVKQLQA